MLKNKGQITVFMILGIVILLAVGLVLYLKVEIVNDLDQEIDYFNPTSVQIFIEGCLQDTLENGIYLVAQQGGYYELPVFSTKDAYVNTAFYLYLGDQYVPSEETLKDSLENYIEENLLNCVNYSYFEGMEVNDSLPQAEVTLSEDYVDVNLDYNVQITPKEGLTSELNSFTAESQAKLLTLFNIALNITQEQQENNEMVCLSCLGLLGSMEYGIRTFTVDSDEGTLYGIFEMDSEVRGPNDENLQFRFMHKYYDDTDYGTYDCNNAQLWVNITRVNSSGSGNVEENIYVGFNEETYSSLEMILLVDSNGKQIIDEGIYTNIPGIALSRDENFITVALRGGRTSEDLELVDFRINFEGVIVTDVEDDEDDPLENYNDGSYEDDPNDDELSYEIGQKYVDAYLRVTSGSDRFYVYYECEEE